MSGRSEAKPELADGRTAAGRRGCVPSACNRAGALIETPVRAARYAITANAGLPG